MKFGADRRLEARTDSKDSSVWRIRFCSIRWKKKLKNLVWLFLLPSSHLVLVHVGHGRDWLLKKEMPFSFDFGGTNFRCSGSKIPPPLLSRAFDHQPSRFPPPRPFLLLPPRVRGKVLKSENGMTWQTFGGLFFSLSLSLPHSSSHSNARPPAFCFGFCFCQLPFTICAILNPYSFPVRKFCLGWRRIIA